VGGQGYDRREGGGGDVDKIRCPSCHTENEQPQSAGPFFCAKCHGIIDPKGALRAGRPGKPEAPPPMSMGAGGGASAPSSAAPQSLYGSAQAPLGSPFAEGPRKIQGPGASVGGSITLGYVLAGGAAIGLAIGFGLLSTNVLRLPIVYPLLIGWGIKRALALGAGGGTPDRGPIGALLLLAYAVAAFGILRYIEYLKTDAKESARSRAIYGRFPPGETKYAIAELRQRDTDNDGKLEIPEIGETIDIGEEEQRLQDAFITGILPNTGYDIALLQASGKKGFTGHVWKVIKKGDTVTLRPDKKGMAIGGIGMAILWLAELALLFLAAFARIDDD
jgi:hypothetical protein